MNYEIEHNQPFPEPIGQGHKPRKAWPFKDMGIDSRLKVQASDWLAAQRAAHTYGQKTGTRFATRLATTGDFGYIWRIA